MGYLINCEYFDNLNENEDMAGTGIMAGICTSSYPSPYPTEKVGDSPYPYPYTVNAGIPCQNGDGFGQYPRGRVYLPSLLLPIKLFPFQLQHESISSWLNGVIKSNHGWPQYLVAPCYQSIIKGRCDKSLNKEGKHL